MIPSDLAAALDLDERYALTEEIRQARLLMLALVLGCTTVDPDYKRGASDHWLQRLQATKGIQ